MPGRVVATFPSGLVRIDQTYICPTSSADLGRASLTVGSSLPDQNQSPSVDGLFIFPTTQEVEREDGFTEFKASAYGRTSTAMSTPVLVQDSATYYNSKLKFFNVSASIVIESSRALTVDDLTISQEILRPYSVTFMGQEVESFYLSGIYGEWESYGVTINSGLNSGFNFLIQKPQIKILSSRNFGSWTEFDIITTRGVDLTGAL